MKKFFVVLLVLASILVIGCGQQAAVPAPAAEAAPVAAAPAAPTFSVNDFARGYMAGLANNNNIVAPAAVLTELREGKAPFIVDIRQSDVYGEAHLQGAINLPWSTPAMWESLEYLPTDQKVYVHCYTGQTAGQFIVMAKMAGIDAVSISSGWNLGISKVEGYEALTETTPNVLNTSTSNGVSDAVVTIVQEYFADMATRNGTPFANNMLSEETAKSILDAKDQGVQFVSMRRPADFAAGHIETAVNVPFNGDMWEGTALLPTDKALVSYCYSGQTCNQGIALLRLLGYDAYSIQFGMGTATTAPRGWANKGFPVVASN